MLTKWIWEWLGLIVFLVAILTGQFGCVGKDATDAQVKTDIDYKMKLAQMAIDVAEKTGTAYHVVVEVGGKPSIGETVDLYFNTDVSLKVIFFGNGASARQPNPPPM